MEDNQVYWKYRVIIIMDYNLYNNKYLFHRHKLYYIKKFIQIESQIQNLSNNDPKLSYYVQ